MGRGRKGEEKARPSSSRAPSPALAPPPPAPTTPTPPPPAPTQTLPPSLKPRSVFNPLLSPLVAKDFRPPALGGFMNFLQDPNLANFTVHSSTQPPHPTYPNNYFQYPQFCTQPPPRPTCHPSPSIRDYETPSPSSHHENQVPIDLDADEESRQRLYYISEEDIRLVSAWLRNSVNPIEGNAKKSDYCWKEVTATYNSTTESERKRDVKNLKNHWYKTTKKVTSFNGCYNQIRGTYASGRCDKQLMQQALDLYYSRHGHHFTYVHWWEAVKESQKWKIHVYTEGDGTKRSSPEPIKNRKRPPGCKSAKRAKWADKEVPGDIKAIQEQIGTFLHAQSAAKVQTDEMMELQSRLSAEKVEANRFAYHTAKEKKEAKIAEERTKLFDKFTTMLNADTTRMESWAKEAHIKAVTRMGEELFARDPQE